MQLQLKGISVYQCTPDASVDADPPEQDDMATSLLVAITRSFPWLKNQRTELRQPRSVYRLFLGLETGVDMTWSCPLLRAIARLFLRLDPKHRSRRSNCQSEHGRIHEIQEITKLE
jgi:hypothetical protein